jgi:hypothetical protein
MAEALKEGSNVLTLGKTANPSPLDLLAEFREGLVDPVIALL